MDSGGGCGGWARTWGRGSDSGLELVADALDRDDVVVTDFLAQLADVHVDGAVSHDHLAAPDAAVDFLAREELPG